MKSDLPWSDSQVTDATCLQYETIILYGMILPFSPSKKYWTLQCFVCHWLALNCAVLFWGYCSLVHEYWFLHFSGSLRHSECSHLLQRQSTCLRHVDTVLSWLAEAELEGVKVAECSWEYRSAVTSEYKLDNESGEKEQPMIKRRTEEKRLKK